MNITYKVLSFALLLSMAPTALYSMDNGGALQVALPGAGGGETSSTGLQHAIVKEIIPATALAQPQKDGDAAAKPTTQPELSPEALALHEEISALMKDKEAVKTAAAEEKASLKQENDTTKRTIRVAVADYESSLQTEQEQTKGLLKRKAQIHGQNGARLAALTASAKIVKTQHAELEKQLVDLEQEKAAFEQNLAGATPAEKSVQALIQEAREREGAIETQIATCKQQESELDDQLDGVDSQMNAQLAEIDQKLGQKKSDLERLQSSKTSSGGLLSWFFGSATTEDA